MVGRIVLHGFEVLFSRMVGRIVLHTNLFKGQGPGLVNVLWVGMLNERVAVVGVRVHHPCPWPLNFTSPDTWPLSLGRPTGSHAISGDGGVGLCMSAPRSPGPRPGRIGEP